MVISSSGLISRQFKPVVHNESSVIAAADAVQTKYTPLPDYSVRGKSAAELDKFCRRCWLGNGDGDSVSCGDTAAAK